MFCGSSTLKRLSCMGSTAAYAVSRVYDDNILFICGMLLSVSGTPQLAAVDPLQKLKSLCKAKDIWLHVDG